MDLLARINYAHTGGAKLAPIPWPAGLEPVCTAGSASDTDPLPAADVLVVTYTAAEGQALADVLTPGHPSSEWTSYRNGWDQLKNLIQGHRAPSLYSNRAGVWSTCTIGNTNVTLVKSDLHPSTDGPELPMVNLWQQMIAQVQPKLVITTGTAGGVGADTALGDVIVSSRVRWDATTKFKSASWAHDTYNSDAGAQVVAAAAAQMKQAQQVLFPANSGRLPAGPPPTILADAGDVVTTDFFAFDDASDHYGLRSYEPSARAVEMDDGALGLACAKMSAPPAWVSVRNASDPQMTGGNIREEDREAAQIYRKYGYWTTVNSAVACWALVASL
jgi:nucleoside phosphorylase